MTTLLILLERVRASDPSAKLAWILFGKGVGTVKFSTEMRVAILAFLLMVLTLQPAAGQPGSTRYKQGDTEFSISAFPSYQFNTDLEDGGDYNVRRYFLRFDVNRQVTETINAGIGLSYDLEEWDFDGATGFQAIPWENIHRVGMDVSFQYTGIEGWTIFFLPGIQSARESGADWNDSLQGGGALAAAYRVFNNLTLGVGAGVYIGLEDTEAYPFLMIRWQITDRLMLANPFRPGPAGPAGLELLYSPDENWTVAAGSAYRSFRFRLDDRAPAKDGIGEVSFVPVWGRLTHRIGRSWALDLYGGFAFGGELVLEDKDGDKIGETDQDPAPFGAFVVSYTF